MLIQIKVLSGSIYCKNTEPIYGGADGAQAAFSFDGEWRGCAKTAVMFRAFGTQYSIPLQNDTCPIPTALLKGAGRLYIGVYGVSGERTVSTGFTSVEIFAGASDGGVSEPPEAYAYTRLLEMITKAVEDTQLFRTEMLNTIEEHRRENEETVKIYVESEGLRSSNEQQRQENEAERVAKASAFFEWQQTAAVSEEERRLAEIKREENEAQRIRSCVSKSYLDDFIENQLGDISAAFDELHAYAQALVNGGI